MKTPSLCDVVGSPTLQVPWYTGSKHTGELVLLGKSFLHVLPENKSINHKIQVKS